MARKKARSAKQKANDKRLGLMAKRRAKKSTPKRKAPKQKASKRRSTPKRKANKRKTTPKRKMAKKNFVSKITGNPTLKKVLMAAGAVTVATSIAAVVAPQLVPTLQRPIVKAALGFATGDIIGAASNFVLAGGAGNLVGGSNSNINNINSGFA